MFWLCWMLFQWVIIELLLMFIVWKKLFKCFHIFIFFPCPLLIKFYIALRTRLILLFHFFSILKLLFSIHYLLSGQVKRIFYFSFGEESNGRSFSCTHNWIVSVEALRSALKWSTFHQLNLILHRLFYRWSRRKHFLSMGFNEWMFGTNFIFNYFFIFILLILWERPGWRFIFPIKMIWMIVKLSIRYTYWKSKISPLLSRYCWKTISWWFYFIFRSRFPNFIKRFLLLWTL